MKIIGGFLLIALVVGGSVGGALYSGIMAIDSEGNISFNIPGKAAAGETTEATEMANGEPAPTSDEDIQDKNKQFSEIDYSDPKERGRAVILVDKELKQKRAKTLAFIKEHTPHDMAKKTRNAAIMKWVEKYE